jgi:NAD(P)-dependent dehydrogenase (short-subunit alcohol dehydrogenase family)
MSGDPAADDAASSPAGRVALVTGGASGLGAAVVRSLMARGWALAIHCHSSLREARSLAAAAATEESALAVTADLREEPAVRALVHRVADHFGRIDAVVTCAAIDRPTPWEELSPADLRSHFEIACIGGFILAQEAAAVMFRQAEGGSIVMPFDSTTVPTVPGHVAAFTAAAAIPGLVRSLAVELAAQDPRLRINGLAVGPRPLPFDRVAEAVVRLVASPAANGSCPAADTLAG